MVSKLRQRNGDFFKSINRSRLGSGRRAGAAGAGAHSCTRERRGKISAGAWRRSEGAVDEVGRGEAMARSLPVL